MGLNSIKLFLDSSALIYWIEAREPFYSRLKERFRDAGTNGDTPQIIVSRLSFLECLVHPCRAGDTETADLYRDFFADPCLVIVDLLPQVVEIALDLRVRYGFRTPDALQAGCAVAVSGTCIFLTGDRQFRRIRELAVEVI